MAEKIGFIGVGIMGGPMVKNLIKAGYAVTAYDVVPAALESVSKGAVGKVLWTRSRETSWRRGGRRSASPPSPPSCIRTVAVSLDAE